VKLGRTLCLVINFGCGWRLGEVLYAVLERDWNLDLEGASVFGLKERFRVARG
jgi:hypothetical protein